MNQTVQKVLKPLIKGLLISLHKRYNYSLYLGVKYSL